MYASLKILSNQSHSLILSMLLCPKVKRIHITWKDGKLTDFMISWVYFPLKTFTLLQIENLTQHKNEMLKLFIWFCFVRFFGNSVPKIKNNRLVWSIFLISFLDHPLLGITFFILEQSVFFFHTSYYNSKWISWFVFSFR